MTTPSTVRDSRESWAGNPPLRGAARRRLIEATARCVVRDGFAATHLSSVAAEAGVSRPTVYRYFADRHALVLATVLHAGRRLADALALHLKGFRGDPHRMAVEAMLYVLNEVPRNPLLDALWSGATLDAALLAEFTRPEVVALGRDALDELVKEAGWNAEEADEAVGWMLRILLSLLAAPVPQGDEAALRGLLTRRLLPALPLSPHPSTPGENR